VAFVKGLAIKKKSSEGKKLDVVLLGAVLRRVGVGEYLLCRHTFAGPAVVSKKLETDAHLPKNGVNTG
jgi:hypothetical protein